jgi:hypothetical protein
MLNSLSWISESQRGETGVLYDQRTNCPFSLKIRLLIGDDGVVLMSNLLNVFFVLRMG